MSTVKIAVLGAGTVGSEVVRLLGELADDFTARVGAKLRIIGIAVSSLEKARADWIDPALLTTDASTLVRRADIVVELIGGIEPARALITEALSNGASVVTGNKALMAAHGPELFAIASENDADLYYEAAVAGAVPVVYAMRESLAGDSVTRVLGIMNGTTNFILDQMTENGADYATALAEAQSLGFAEADPTADVDGHDAAAKVALLSSLAFHTRIPLDSVSCTGIRGVTPQTISAAEEAGYVVKLLAVGERVDDGVCVVVEPALVPTDHPLATVHGSYNAVLVEADAAGRLMFYGRGAGGAPTASAVLSDLVAAAGHRVHGGAAPKENSYSGLPVLPASQLSSAAHVQIRLTNDPGSLARVAECFGRHGVSLETVHQVPATDGAVLSAVTHPARGEALQRVVADLNDESCVAAVESVLRVESSS